MCVWTLPHPGLASFGSAVMNTHECQSAFEGSAVQNGNQVSVFELSPPLFDIGSDVATRGASWAAVSCRHARRRPSSVERSLRVSPPGLQAADMPY